MAIKEGQISTDKAPQREPGRVVVEKPNSSGRDAATIVSIHTGDENSGTLSFCL